MNAPSVQIATAFAGGAKRLDSSLGSAESGGRLAVFSGRRIATLDIELGDACKEEGATAGSGAVGGRKRGVVFCATGIGIGTGGVDCALTLAVTIVTIDRAEAERSSDRQQKL
jgi:hypothetical protein